MPVVIQPRRLNVRKTVFVASVLIALFVYTYLVRDPAGPVNPVFGGQTMGTTYEVKIAGSDLGRRELIELRRQIAERLLDLNRQMSTYEDDTEISRFNAQAGTAPVRVSPDFAAVTAYAVRLSESTGGAFDPTLDPLINLWGFGRDGRPASSPSGDAVAAARARCGAGHLTALPDFRLQKDIPGLHLNLNAVAKGYAVDQVSLLLADRGLTNTYVEIGGEVVIRGTNLDGQPWRIGIDLPRPGGTPGADLARILSLSDRAVATSGDYRNFYREADGTRRTHILDPRTGFPIDHAVASVSVVAPTCMEADGAATALMVLGVEEGLQWVEAQPGMEALFLVRGDDGSFEEAWSTGFGDYVQPTGP